jgi:hypothetical protein
LADRLLVVDVLVDDVVDSGVVDVLLVVLDVLDVVDPGETTVVVLEPPQAARPRAATIPATQKEALESIFPPLDC